MGPKVVIIGGGAIGASCLYHLTERGITDAVLLEKDHLCSGSSGRSAGVVETQAALCPPRLPAAGADTGRSGQLSA